MNSGVVIVIVCLFLVGFLFGFLDVSIRDKKFRKKTHEIPNDCSKKKDKVVRIDDFSKG